MTANLFHFSYHKCLTMYFRRVMRRTFATVKPTGIDSQYAHAASKLDRFEEMRKNHRMVSLNNHYVSPASLGENFRATRFIRDPRDLLVSGYFYHKRGAEPWCLIKNPTNQDWEMVNGRVPETMPAGPSFAEYLTDAPTEEGLLAELDFRRAHFDSMADWPLDDERILLLSYDEMMRDEVSAYTRIFDHLGIKRPRRQVGLHFVKKMSVQGSKGAKQGHVRDPKSGQWANVLTPRVISEFEARHGALLEKYQGVFAV